MLAFCVVACSSSSVFFWANNPPLWNCSTSVLGFQHPLCLYPPVVQLHTFSLADRAICASLAQIVSARNIRQYFCNRSDGSRFAFGHSCQEERSFHNGPVRNHSYWLTGPTDPRLHYLGRLHSLSLHVRGSPLDPQFYDSDIGRVFHAG